MKKITFLSAMIFISFLSFGQVKRNVFMIFSEFKTNSPSKYIDFQLKQRTMGNVFMTGGITNHSIKKVNPSTKTEELTKIVWGITVADSIYINSYPYSKILGYNKILGVGFYSYFIGEPARSKEQQIKIGIIEEGEPHKEVCCKTSYVILPDGSVKWLNLELLKTLIADDSELSKELETTSLTSENVFEMFAFLNKYNQGRN
jgi:hypothetical protein